MDAKAENLVKEFYPALCLDHGLCAVIGAPRGSIEGLVLLRTVKFWYSSETVLEERGLFIYPQFRSAKGGRARKLVEYSKHVADQLGMPLIMGVLSNTRTEGKVKLYTRLFGPPAGAFFLYGARTTGHVVN